MEPLSQEEIASWKVFRRSGPPFGPGKEDLASHGLADVLRQVEGDGFGQPDQPPRAPGLGLADDHAARLHNIALDPEPAADEVHVGDTESYELAPSQGREGAHEHRAA
jgi:hypothetical protein